MLTNVGQLLSIDTENSGVHQRVEVGDDAAVHSIAQTVILCVHNGGQSIESGAGRSVRGHHGTGLAVVHQQDEGHVLVHDLEGAVGRTRPLWKEPELTHCISIIRQMEVE